MLDLSKYINGKNLFDGRYRLIRLLSAEGGTADVWLAENFESVETRISEETDDVVRVDGTGVLVAIKIYRPKNILDVDGEQSFRAEFKTIFNCHHTNLLPTTDYSICDGMPYLVMPFCEKGSVESLVGKLENEDDVWKFLADVSAGLSYLHSLVPPIIHHDIKPANILIDANGNYCITDFGISIKSGVDGEGCSNRDSRGTAAYMPPERFKNEYIPDTSSDVWALGATVYELLTGDVPFGNRGGEAQSKGVRIPAIKNKSKKVTRIIHACLNYDSQKRPSALYINEYARRKGKKNSTRNILGVLIMLVVSLVGLLIWILSNKPFVNYLVHENDGDTIISVQKHNDTIYIGFEEKQGTENCQDPEKDDGRAIEGTLTRLAEGKYIGVEGKQETGNSQDSENDDTRTIKGTVIRLSEGVYKQTRYQRGDLPEENYPFEIYKIVKSSGAMQIEFFNRNPVEFLFSPCTIDKRDIINYTENSFDYRWKCNMRHKTIEYGTIVREHYDRNFVDRRGLPQLFQVLSGRVPASDKSLIGVWKQCNSNDWFECYRVYTPKLCFVIRIHRFADDAHSIQQISGGIYTVVYLKNGDTEECGNLYQVEWSDQTSYKLTRQVNGQPASDYWKRAVLPPDFVYWFK